MNEEFLHFIWQNRLFANSGISSSDGDDIEILNTGQHNTHAGPDFFNAQVRINNTVWAGNVEIHLNSSDWIKHNHHKDPAYNNVILHVVANDDIVVNRTNGEKITTITLSYKEDILEKYNDLLAGRLWIPCQRHFGKVDRFTIDYWLNSLLVERLENKTDSILSKLNDNKNDWNEVCYRLIARNFGYKINAEPFELLARSLPYKFIAKHNDRLPAAEAMLFGQAGMFDKNDIEDDYYMQLKAEYEFYKIKFKLVPIDKYLWKYLRLRPSNFPTIRLSQFANLLHRSGNLFSDIIDCKSLKDVIKLFDNISTSAYWETHYVFGKTSPARIKVIGRSFIDIILINTVVPLLFIYGKLHDDEGVMNKSLTFLEEIEPENNSIIHEWQNLGIDPVNAYQSQALLELKNEYCARKNCLRCMIGSKIMMMTSDV